MTNRTDGGLAYPVSFQAPYFDGVEDCRGHLPSTGMTMRDWFAGQALMGICARNRYAQEYGTPEKRAANAFRQADAMLKERDKSDAGST